jgi:putative intracellular protease/amidase
MAPRILHVVTNVARFDNLDKATGLWLGELTHAYDALERAGCAQDIASPKGGPVPIDPRSLGWLVMDDSIRARRADPRFMGLLDRSLAIADVDPAAYDAIYLTGGHGVMWDFPDDAGLQAAVRAIYEKGGIVSSVCHGYCGLLNVRLSDGRLLIGGRKITGFSWLEEIAAGVAGKVPYNAEKAARQRGADYVKALIPFRPFAVTDGRLVTGQNPFSAREMARRIIEVLGRPASSTAAA